MKETVYLIDGANYIYRAYYAIRFLSTSKGFPTNALYGFTQMILRFLREKNPRYMAVVFDTPEPTFRDELYEEYKANRKAPPDDLIQQFPFFKPILKALNIPIMEMPGFEADDIIGTLAKKFSDEGFDVVIVSGDKDMMQMVGGAISMFDSMKDRSIGEKEVEEQFGVPPSKLIDVLGLAGDSSDNVPGVEGIGRATAAKLIRLFESMENVIDNADKLSGGLAYKIKRDADKARLSKELVTLKTDVPIECDSGDLALSAPDEAKLRELFGEFEFTKLLMEIAPVTNVDRSAYKMICTKDELDEWIVKIKKAGKFSFDTETTSLDILDAEIVGISLATAPGEASYIPVGHVESGSAPQEKSAGDLFAATHLKKGQLPLSDVLAKLGPILADESIKKVGQNLKYDVGVLKRYKTDVKGLYCDTMIASYLLNPGGAHNLDTLSQVHLGHKKITYAELTGKGKKQKCFSEVDMEAASAYSCEDADVALRLADLFLPKLEEQNLSKLFFELEMPLIDVLLEMELAGMKIDLGVLKKLSSEFDERLGLLEKKIYEEAGEEFNINSPRQLGVVFFEKLKLGTPKTTKTGYSTDIDVLEELSLKHDLPKLVLEYRSLSKLKSTYIDALLLQARKETGRVHTSFNQTVAATGRLSSSNPNLQNIPVRGEEGKKIRAAFIADRGFTLVSADYSQIELRVLAELSGDKALKDAFGKGEDVHRLTAAGIFGVKPDKVSGEQRSVGKTVNFATIYGQGPFGLSRQLGIEVGEAKRYIDSYFERYPAVEKYREKILDKARKDGFVQTLFGRKRYVADIESKNAAVRQASERMAFNTVFQGTAADIIKKAMIRIHNDIKEKFPGSRMLMQVHDELLFEVPEKDAQALAAWAKGIMENVVDIEVPLVADVGIGPNWSEAH